MTNLLVMNVIAKNFQKQEQVEGLLLNNQTTKKMSIIQEDTDQQVKQAFYLDHGNQVWGPEGLYCDGWTQQMAQQICDALNLLPSALFWLTYAEGNHLDAGDIPGNLLSKLSATIGAEGSKIYSAGAGQDFDYATKTGLIQ